VKIAALTILLSCAAAVAAEEEPVNEPGDAAVAKVRDVLRNEATRQLVHGSFSAGCFNACWELIDREDRSEEETEDMVVLANASLWHWKQREDCEPRNLSIAYWLLGRVNALAGDLDLARHYGGKSLAIATEHELDPFYVGYAHEALARAHVLGEAWKAAEERLRLAREQLQLVDEEDEHQLLHDDVVDLEGALWDATAP